MDLIEKTIKERRMIIEGLENKLAILKKKQTMDLVKIRHCPEYKIKLSTKSIPYYLGYGATNMIELSCETRGS